MRETTRAGTELLKLHTRLSCMYGTGHALPRVRAAMTVPLLFYEFQAMKAKGPDAVFFMPSKEEAGKVSC